MLNRKIPRSCCSPIEVVQYESVLFFTDSWSLPLLPYVLQRFAMNAQDGWLMHDKWIAQVDRQHNGMGPTGSPQYVGFAPPTDGNTYICVHNPIQIETYFTIHSFADLHLAPTIVGFRSSWEANQRRLFVGIVYSLSLCSTKSNKALSNTAVCLYLPRDRRFFSVL